MTDFRLSFNVRTRALTGDRKFSHRWVLMNVMEGIYLTTGKIES